MGLFVSSKKEKETWASIVLSGIKPGMQIDDALLEKVADIYINQHAVTELYDRIVDRNLLVRRINITANRLVDESSVRKEEVYEQLDLFTDYETQRKKQEEEAAALDREKRMQEAMLSIKKKFGKNAVLKGMNLQEGSTARDRNEQIGGHKA